MNKRDLVRTTVRIPGELLTAIYAAKPRNITLNQFICDAVQNFCNEACRKPISENKFNYKADLLERLKDRGYAQLYLVAATKESQETFLLALRDVAEAQKGMTQLAVEADVNRENLYRALSEEGNPTLSTLSSVLDVLGMELQPILKQSFLTDPGPFRAGPENISETTLQPSASGIQGARGLQGSASVNGMPLRNGTKHGRSKYGVRGTNITSRDISNLVGQRAVA